MAKYIALEDIITLDTIVFKKGDEIIVNDGQTLPQKIGSTFGSGELSIKLSSIKDKVKLKEEFDIKLSLLDDEDEIKDYRIQLDLKVSRRKAKEIENYLRETLETML